jgi:hypothetical protein
MGGFLALVSMFDRQGYPDNSIATNGEAHRQTVAGNLWQLELLERSCSTPISRMKKPATAVERSTHCRYFLMVLALCRQQCLVSAIFKAQRRKCAIRREPLALAVTGGRPMLKHPLKRSSVGWQGASAVGSHSAHSTDGTSLDKARLQHVMLRQFERLSRNFFSPGRHHAVQSMRPPLLYDALVNRIA